VCGSLLVSIDSIIILVIILIIIVLIIILILIFVVVVVDIVVIVKPSAAVGTFRHAAGLAMGAAARALHRTRVNGILCPVSTVVVVTSGWRGDGDAGAGGKGGGSISPSSKTEEMHGSSRDRRRGGECTCGGRTRGSVHG
jgi:type IV secretory pathway TrbL component